MPNSLGSVRESSSDSSGSGVTSLVRGKGGMSPSQLAAASPRRVTTSPTSGRNSVVPSQQRWVKPHNESDNPMATAFSGLSGRFPRTTKCPRADCGISWNGVSPVRTWRKHTYKRPAPATVRAYLEDNQSKRVDVCLWRGNCAFLTKLLRYQEFRRHKRHAAAL